MTVETASALTIRPLTPDDADLVSAHLRDYWLDTGYRIFPTQQVHPGYAVHWIFRELAQTAHPAAVFLAEWDGQFAGWAGGSVIPFIMLPDFRYCWEWLWWVRAPYRAHPIAHTLWRTLRAWGKRNGAQGCMYGRPGAVGKKTFEETLHWRVW